MDVVDAISTGSTQPLGGGLPVRERRVDPASEGVDARALDAVLAAFRAQQRQHRFPGGQIVIRRRGRLLLDATVGLARGFRPGEAAAVVTPTTRFPVFSSGKPLVAMAIALLDERGLLDVHAPIAHVFPEFGARGKERITTVDVLTHRGGILMPEFSRRPRDWADWNKVVDAICATRPTYARGTLAYHPLEYGWVLAEIVRRVTGMPMPRFLDEELLHPAGLHDMRFGATLDEIPHLARSYWLGPERVLIGELNIATMLESAIATPEVATAFVPGAGLVTDAMSLARFYDLLLAGGVTRGGRRLLRPDTVRRYVARHAYGWCRTNRAPLAVGRGFLLGTRGPSLYGWWNSTSCFGHAGAFCTVAFADEETDLSVAMITNGNAGPSDLVRRFLPLCDRIRAAVRKPSRVRA